MQISLFNVKVVFQSNVPRIDKVGNHINGWEDFYTCHATVSGEGGTEKEMAGQTVEPFEIAFTVRYSKKLDYISSTGYRIIFKDEIYDIISIDHMNYKKKAYKFRCRRVKR